MAKHTQHKKSSSRRGRSKLGANKHHVPTSTRQPTPPPPTFDGYYTPNPFPSTPSESAHEALNRIQTSLDAEAFQSGLGRLFNSRLVPEEDQRRWIPANAPTTAEEEQVVDKQFIFDVARGQLAGPYTVEELEAAARSPIRTAPLRVIPKGSHIPPPPVKKWRIIENLSAPRKPRGEITSVNWTLDSDYEKCTWTSTAMLEQRFLGYADDVEVMGIDLIEGFMHIPVHPDSRPWFCLFWRGSVWIRKVASYGARTTPAIFGNCVDATITMMENDLPVEAFAQVDDIGIARKGKDVTDAQVRDYLRNLGWNVHPVEAEKGFTWSRIFKHNGIIWDLDAKTKTLTNDKREKYLAFVKALHVTGSASLSDMEKLLGYLVYVCSIVRHRKSALFTFFRFRRGFKDEFGIHSFNRVDREALREWIEYLESPVITASFEKPTSKFHTEIYTDASNIGIGVVAGSHAAAFSFKSTWRDDYDAHIGPAKAWGVEAGLEAAILMGAKDCELTLHCDNSGVVFAWLKGWSRNKLQNESISRLMEATMEHNILLTIKYINTTENPADPLSREYKHWPTHYTPFPIPLSDPYGTIFGPAP
ncbi:hypothetical protein P7C70_g8614, partial [Phenoliferia sp. Uapishka_3]